jgi:hypothetical protein
MTKLKGVMEYKTLQDGIDCTQEYMFEEADKECDGSDDIAGELYSATFSVDNRIYNIKGVVDIGWCDSHYWVESIEMEQPEEIKIPEW